VQNPSNSGGEGEQDPDLLLMPRRLMSSAAKNQNTGKSRSNSKDKRNSISKEK